MADAAAGTAAEQVELTAGPWRAVVRALGATLAAVERAGRPVIHPAPDGPNPAAHGAVLVPWPNRLGDGTYVWDGVEHQLPLTEPNHRNAIHGLAGDRIWSLTDRTLTSVTCTLLLGDEPGYPFPVEVSVRHDLTPDGLTVTTTATNRGDVDAPFGAGHHPYLSPGALASGPGAIDACTVRLPAATRIVTDDRLLPVGTAPVDGTEFDLRTPTLLGARRLDTAFTDLARDPDGLARAWLTGPDGITVTLWADHGYPFLQAYTADHDGPTGARRALAVEPMTCPADAFRTGDHLLRLTPGTTATATWGLTAG